MWLLNVALSIFPQISTLHHWSFIFQMKALWIGWERTHYIKKFIRGINYWHQTLCGNFQFNLPFDMSYLPHPSASPFATFRPLENGLYNQQVAHENIHQPNLVHCSHSFGNLISNLVIHPHDPFKWTPCCYYEIMKNANFTIPSSVENINLWTLCIISIYFWGRLIYKF